MRRAEQEPEALLYTLENIRRLDRWIANPGYVLLLITGTAMMLEGGIPISRPWLATSIGLYIGVIILAVAAYAPSFRAQIRMAASFGPRSQKYRQAKEKARWLGGIVTLMTLTILALMVLKPDLWA
jgi:uncharacterized membrane protein